MEILREFTAHFGIQPGRSPRQLLEEVVVAFSRLPYENITKIIKLAECGSPDKARRHPEEVIGNHIAWGSGGTCFSLTSALLQLVRSLGWDAECILADRSYGQNTHCALLLRIDGVPHLVDPGFLIVRPIPIAAKAEQQIETGFNRLILAHDSKEDRISLSTERQGSRTYRLTYKTSPVDRGEFLKAWDASFDWDMMHYPLLTRLSGSGQIYLRGSRFQVIGTDSVQTREIKSEYLADQISSEFRIDPALVAHAISILKRGG